MFTGFVPRAFAEHHNPLWYRELVEQEVNREEKDAVPVAEK
jgi:cytochrome b subunit of formate dehydrogenase